VWSVDIDGGNSRQLTHADRESGPAIPLSINASGDTMLVVYPNLLRFGGAERSSYGLVNLPSGKTEAIEIGIPDQTGIGRPLTATLSPDGAHLIYVTRLTVPEHRVVVRDLATGTDQIAMYSLLDAVTLGIDSGLTWASNQTIFVPTGLDRGVVLTLGSDATSPQTPVPPMLMTPSPITASPTAPALAIEEGATVVVNDDNVNLRAGPAIDAPIIALLARGTELIVIGPAETGDGFVWWPVRDPSSRQIGFVRAEFLFRLGGR
jgi:hypothetical protein